MALNCPKHFITRLTQAGDPVGLQWSGATVLLTIARLQARNGTNYYCRTIEQYMLHASNFNKAIEARDVNKTSNDKTKTLTDKTKTSCLKTNTISLKTRPRHPNNANLTELSLYIVHFITQQQQHHHRHSHQ